MRKTNQMESLIIAVILGTLMISCSKQDPEPGNSNNSTNNNNNNTTVVTESSTLCEDSICNIPFRIMSTFLPSGYYEGADQSVDLLIDSCGETPTYPGQGLRIRYTKGTLWGWGAHFLNNNNWDGTFKVSPNATKITLYAKVDYSANVTFNAFANETYGKLELYKKANPVTPVWEKITIPLLGRPASFSAPLNIVIDGVTTPGTVTIVDIKDVLIE
jgi:hypothetical protein